MKNSTKLLLFVLLTIPLLGYSQQYITLTSNVDDKPVINQLEISADTITVVSGDKMGGAFALMIAQFEILFYCACFFAGTQVCGGVQDARSVRYCAVCTFVVGIIMSAMLYTYAIYFA